MIHKEISIVVGKLDFWKPIGAHLVLFLFAQFCILEYDFNDVSLVRLGFFNVEAAHLCFLVSSSIKFNFILVFGCSFSSIYLIIEEFFREVHLLRYCDALFALANYLDLAIALGAA